MFCSVPEENREIYDFFLQIKGQYIRGHNFPKYYKDSSNRNSNKIDGKGEGRGLKILIFFYLGDGKMIRLPSTFLH